MIFDPFIFTDKVVVTVGHYGCGKTNFSINLAKKLSEKSEVFLVDYDNVNPYFRAVDAKETLKNRNITVISSEFANTNVDIPSSPENLHKAFFKNRVNGASVIIDVGGDMLGAISLGTLHENIISADCEVLYVFNAFRPLTDTPEKAREIMLEIESASRLKVTGLINNSNIGNSTAADDVEITDGYAKELSEITGVPLICTAHMTDAVPCVNTMTFKMRNYTKHIF